MTTTNIHKVFKPLKRYLPASIATSVRNIGTALLTPIRFSIQSGHFISSLKMAAVSKYNQPIPWYTYPCIDFIKHIDFSKKNILEFGGGQSTLWWSKKSQEVLTIEGDQNWFFRIKSKMPSNVHLYYAPMGSATENVSEVKKILNFEKFSKFDVVIIDGLYRREMIEIALTHLSSTGIIICDNSESYGFFEAMRESPFMKIDFYGYAPGVFLPHCTTIYFRPDSVEFFSAKNKIYTPALE